MSYTLILVCGYTPVSHREPVYWASQAHERGFSRLRHRPPLRHSHGGGRGVVPGKKSEVTKQWCNMGLVASPSGTPNGLLNRLFKPTTKEKSKLRITGPLWRQTTGHRGIDTWWEVFWILLPLINVISTRCSIHFCRAFLNSALVSLGLNVGTGPLKHFWRSYQWRTLTGDSPNQSTHWAHRPNRCNHNGTNSSDNRLGKSYRSVQFPQHYMPQGW